ITVLSVSFSNRKLERVTMVTLHLLDGRAVQSHSCTRNPGYPRSVHRCESRWAIPIIYKTLCPCRRWCSRKSKRNRIQCRPPHAVVCRLRNILNDDPNDLYVLERCILRRGWRFNILACRRVDGGKRLANGRSGLADS